MVEQLPLEEDLMHNEPAHDVPDVTALESSTASVPHYLFLGAVTLILLWFWCRRDLVRWMEQKLFCKSMTRHQWVDFLEIFLARLVLEVFGGAGAIWGFSEAIGFRNDNTVWFWRPASLTIGAVFFSRWLYQIRDYMNDHKVTNLSINMMNREIGMVVNHDENDADDSVLPLKVQYGKTSRRGSYGATSSCEDIRVLKARRHSLCI